MAEPANVVEETKVAIAEAEKDVEELFKYKELDFSLPKHDKMKALTNMARHINLNLGEPAAELPAKLKARVWYLRGKAYEAGIEYSKEAEEQLSKAVKLDPMLVDGWNCLGHALWKKNDLVSAQNCYKTALDLVPNKLSLRELSRILRMMAGTSEERKTNLSESLDKAKKAVAMDVRDGESWYVLGNAYLSHYLFNSLDVEDLTRAIQAYRQAESNPVTALNPDMHFNKATVHKYRGEFQQALDGFRRSYQLDPTLEEAQTEGEFLLKLLTNTVHYIDTKCGLKERKLKPVIENLAAPGRVPISALQPGVNKDKEIALRIVNILTPSESVPAVCICSDFEANFCALLMYNCAPGALRLGDIITLPNPNFSRPAVTLPSSASSSSSSSADAATPAVQQQTHEFACVACHFPDRTLWNGKPFPLGRILTPSIRVSLFS